MKKSSAVVALLVVLAGFLPGTCFGQSGYPQTIAVMKTVLTRELLAFARYEACARKAREESCPYIANLAAALSVSESIHARNFRAVLAQLGFPTNEQPPEVSVSDTRTNIKNASTSELEEIDVRYPELLAQLRPENVPAAIDRVDYYVCTACASTLDVLPKEKCPICFGPVSLYEKLNLGG